MAVSTIKTNQANWGFLTTRLNREPVDAASLNNSYTDLLWELNQTSSTYVLGQSNAGGSGNYYVGLITAVPYVNKGNSKGNEDPNMKGPWYVTYSALDPNNGEGKFAFTGHIDDKVAAANTYYADRIVLKRELDYALEKGSVSPLLLGSYYTGVGMWWDSYNTVNGGSRQYIENGKELPDGTYFTTITYSEIFNDYAYNRAEGRYSHAEGYHTYALSDMSHAEGSNTIAYADNAHAEGSNTTAEGENSHTEGTETLASGASSHAEGIMTEANGEYSHSEGLSTLAYGSGSHAEGDNTIAKGEDSHAEGLYTKSIGKGSHVEGNYTIAYNEYEHAEGRYNVSDNINNGGTLHTIGDGTSDTNRHNIVSIYNDRTINVENTNTTVHGSGYFKLNQNGNYVAYVGTEKTPSEYNRTIYGNEKKTISKTSDRRISGTSYEGFGSSHTTSVTGFMSTYAYNGTYTSVKNNSYNYIQGNLGSYIEGTITERSESSVYLSAPNVCIHADPNKDETYIDLAADVTYLYGRTSTYIGQNVHDTNSKSSNIYVKGNVINEESTASNKTTVNSTNIITGDSLTKVTYNTNLETDSLDIKSGQTSFDLGNTHIHAGKELCLKSTKSATFKGDETTKIGQDYEGNKTTDFLITSKTNGNIESETITVNASNKYTETVGTKNVNIAETLTETRAKTVSITNSYNTGTYTTGTSYEYIKDNSTSAVHGTRTEITDGTKTVTNNGGITTTTIGNSYTYIDGEYVLGVQGNTNTIYDGNLSNHTTGNESSSVDGTKTENIKKARTTTIDDHDTLVITRGGRTESIRGNVILDVSNGKIISYTDDSHDTIHHTRSTYIESVHSYIGDPAYTSIQGKYSIGLGQGIKTTSNTNVSVGKYNEDAATYFSVGIGTSDDDRKNAFWISQGTTAGYNGVAYFSNNTYVYGNTYDPGQYTSDEEKEDKSWSQVVTYNMYRNSYTYLYNTISDKFDTFGKGTYFTKSIDPFTYTSTSYTLHYTTQTFDKETNTWPTYTYEQTIPQATPGALENDEVGTAGLMSARDKARLDNIWEGDKQIANIQISSGTWTIYKNDGTTTYNLKDIKFQYNDIANLQVEYGFRPKWSGKWKWTVNNQKNAERCEGEWGTDLPNVNTESNSWTSTVLGVNPSNPICKETIYAAKRGLIISEYPDKNGSKKDGTVHLGSIIPAFGEDNTLCSVNWSTYRILFYGQCTQDEADKKNIEVMSNLSDNTKHALKITGRSWTINYVATATTCFFMGYPAEWGDISAIKKNGVQIITSSFLKVGSVDYTNGAGLTQKYNIYRSGVATADMSISIS